MSLIKDTIASIPYKNTYEAIHLCTGVPAHVYYYNNPSIQRCLQQVIAKGDFDVVLQEYWYIGFGLKSVGEKPLRVIDTNVSTLKGWIFSRQQDGFLPKRIFVSTGRWKSNNW